MFFVYYQGNWSAGGLLGKRQLSARDSNYHKNILVEEREFMRMERKLKKIGPQADGDGGQRGQMKITW